MMRWLIGLLLLGNFLLFLWAGLRPAPPPGLAEPLADVGSLRILGEAGEDLMPPLEAAPETPQAPLDPEPPLAASDSGPASPAGDAAQGPMAAATAAPEAATAPEPMDLPGAAAWRMDTPEETPPQLPPEPLPEPEAAVEPESVSEVESTHGTLRAVQAEPAAEPEPERQTAFDSVPALEAEPAILSQPQQHAAAPMAPESDAPAEAEPAREPQAASESQSEAPTEPAHDQPEPSPAASVPPLPTMVCGELRGFEDEAAARELAERLRAVGATAEVLEVLDQEQTGYWVLIPPAPNRAAAYAALDKLESAKIKDTWLVPAGPLKYAISLGLYTGPSRAAIRAEQIQKIGLPAEVRPKMSDVTRYRLRYQGEEGELEPVRAAAQAQSGLTHRDLPCE